MKIIAQNTQKTQAPTQKSSADSRPQAAVMQRRTKQEQQQAHFDAMMALWQRGFQIAKRPDFRLSIVAIGEVA